MERVFKTLGTNKAVDLASYVKDYVSKRENVSIYVGTDSQNVDGNTVYACVVVLHNANKGGHVLYSKEKVSRIRDRFAKLWKEVEISLEVAVYLKENGVSTKYVDIDLNPDPKYKSNSVLRAAMGFVESMGFVPRCKPAAAAASYAADKLVK